METIFDHNLTPDEKKHLFGPVEFTPKDFENVPQDKNFGLIYKLYKRRGDIKKAKKYLDMIPNSNWKNFTLLNDDLGDCYQKIYGKSRDTSI